MARVVIVGGGIGGLAVAARLAARRHDVTLCERSERWGGMVGSVTRDGFTFGTGPGLLTLPAVYRDLFLKTGAGLEEVAELVPVDPASRCVFADGTVVDVPNASRSGTAAAFEEAFGPGRGEEWNRLVGRAGEMWTVVRPSFVETPLVADPPRRADRLRSAGGARSLRTTARWRSLRSLGGAYLRDPRMRAYLERFALDAGCDPRRAPATLAVQAYLEQTFGLWYVRGGVHRIAELLAERCADLGVRMLAGTEVTGIRTAAGRVAGVGTTVGPLDADVVVTDVCAQALAALLPAGEARRRGRPRREPRAVSVFELHLALEGTSRLPHRTTLFPDDTQAAAAALFDDPQAPPADPMIDVYAPGDPSLVPEGCEGRTVRVRVPCHAPGGGPGTVDWDAAGVADAYAAALLDRLAARGQDVRGRLRRHETRTPADLERATGTPGGAVLGAAADAPALAVGRVANRAAIGGLFSVGASAHPGGGLTRVGMSAALVAELVGKA